MLITHGTWSEMSLVGGFAIVPGKSNIDVRKRTNQAFQEVGFVVS
jgi:hypothetical protein